MSPGPGPGGAWVAAARVIGHGRVVVVVAEAASRHSYFARGRRGEVAIFARGGDRPSDALRRWLAAHPAVLLALAAAETARTA